MSPPSLSVTFASPRLASPRLEVLVQNPRARTRTKTIVAIARSSQKVCRIRPLTEGWPALKYQAAVPPVGRSSSRASDHLKPIPSWAALLGLISRLRVPPKVAFTAGYPFHKPRLHIPPTSTTGPVYHKPSSVSEKQSYEPVTNFGTTKQTQLNHQHFVSLSAVLSLRGLGLKGCTPHPTIRMREPGASTKPSHASHWPLPSKLLDHHHQRAHLQLRVLASIFDCFSSGQIHSAQPFVTAGARISSRGIGDTKRTRPTFFNATCDSILEIFS